MDNMNFLPIVLIFLGLLSISILTLVIPKNGKFISLGINVVNYLVFLFLINTKYDLGLTNLFVLNSLGVKIISIVTVFALIINVLNGYKNFSDVRNSILVNFIFIGSIFLIGSTEFITFYIALELMSLITYALVKMSSQSFSKEAAVKYFIQGSINSAIFLLAISFFFGATGGFDFKNFTVLNQQLYSFSIGLFLIVVFFKMGAFPFHSWVPDVYSNIHKGVLASNFLISKFVIGYILITLVQNLISECLPNIQHIFINIILCVAVASAFFGNIMGLSHLQFKRMIAYSSVAHSGYMLMTIGMNVNLGYEKQLIFYLMFYSISATAVILAINYFLDVDKVKDTYDSLKGGFYKDGPMGLLLTIAVFSLAGIPLTSGFTTKYLLFTNYFKEGVVIPAFALLISSIIGIGYYIRIVIALFMEDANDVKPVSVIPIESKVVLLFLGAIIILGGIIPSWFINF